MTTGERIRKARKEKNMSQKELAEKIGVSASMIGQYENGLRNPKIETIQRIAYVLDVNTYSLVSSNITQLFTGSAQTSIDFDKLEKKLGSLITDREYEIMGLFNKLNESGQQKAIERVEELTEVPKYKKSTSE